MTIAEVREKCKGVLGRIPRDMLIISVLILASLASFGLGYLAGRDAGQGRGKTLPLAIATTTAQFVASKSGTRYYPIDCAAASRISDMNKVWFVSNEAALAAGYAPATNCKGL